MYGSIGKLGITEIECATNQAIAFCQPYDGVNLKYLFRVLQNSRSDLMAQGQGGAQLNISQTILKAHEVPLAPLPEQKRIADKLDSTLARVEACRDRLDRLPALLKRFRQSILAAATSGRLTEDWRKSNNADEPSLKSLALPAGYARLTKRKTEILPVDVAAPDVPKNWLIVSIGELYEKKAIIDFADGNHGSLYPRKEEFGDTGTLFLTASQIDELWNVDLKACSRLGTKKAQQLTKGWALPQDVLLTHNATVGRVGILPIDAEDVLLGTSVTFFRTNPHAILPGYLRIAFSSPFFQDQLRSVMAQTTRDQVPITTQVSLRVPLPGLNEQHEIVRRVETLFAFADRLEARLSTARKQVDQLTPALLAKAFRGELVPQDPADEPASELLKRLAASREQAPKIKRGKNAAGKQPIAPKM